MATILTPTTMQTFTGKLIDLRSFGPDDVRVADIAHALSILNRFTGHSKVPYSVAQHSVMVSRLVAPENALWGLMHDASEAYLGDIARPLKEMLPEYKKIERHVQRVIAKVFGLPWPMPADVKRADNIALMTEKRDLVTADHCWGIDVPADCRPISPYCWQQAKKMFSDRFLEVTHEGG